jgi:hypothetical protein
MEEMRYGRNGTSNSNCSLEQPYLEQLILVVSMRPAATGEVQRPEGVLLSFIFH